MTTNGQHNPDLGAALKASVAVQAAPGTLDALDRLLESERRSLQHVSELRALVGTLRQQVADLTDYIAHTKEYRDAD